MNNTKNLTLNSQIDYWNGQKKTISREGKGMHPRDESGSTRQIQTGAIINPNNAPPQHLEDTCNYALNNIVQLYAERYQKVWQRRQTKKTTRIQRWTNNSAVNWYFGMWCIRTYQTETPITVSQIVEEMYVARTTARRLISECLAEGWIEQKELPDERCTGYVVTDAMYSAFRDYTKNQLLTLNWQKFEDNYRTYQYCLDRCGANLD